MRLSVDPINWRRWVMQTARTSEDLSQIVDSTGIDVIDEDHRKMLEYVLEVNLLVDDMEKRTLDMAFVYRLAELLERFLTYTKEHFTREEELMKQLALPQLEHHRQVHLDILVTLKSYLKDMESGKLTITRTLKHALLDWVVNHINDEDCGDFEPEQWMPALYQAKESDGIAFVFKKVHIDAVDRDHSILLEKILGLPGEAANDANSTETNLEAFLDVRKFIEKHMETERELMECYGFDPVFGEAIFPMSVFDVLDGEGIKTFDSKELRRSIIKEWVEHVNIHNQRDMSIEKWTDNRVKAGDDDFLLLAILGESGDKEIDDRSLQLARSLISMAGRLDRILMLGKSTTSIRELRDASKELGKGVNGHMKAIDAHLSADAGKSKAQKALHRSFKKRMTYLKILIDSDQLGLAAQEVPRVIFQWLRLVDLEEKFS